MRFDRKIWAGKPKAWTQNLVVQARKYLRRSTKPTTSSSTPNSTTVSGSINTLAKAHLDRSATNSAGNLAQPQIRKGQDVSCLSGQGSVPESSSGPCPAPVRSETEEPALGIAKPLDLGFSEVTAARIDADETYISALRQSSRTESRSANFQEPGPVPLPEPERAIFNSDHSGSQHRAGTEAPSAVTTRWWRVSDDDSKAFRSPRASSGDQIDKVANDPTCISMFIHLPGDKAGDRAPPAFGLLDTGSRFSFVFEKTLKELGWEGWENRKAKVLITTLAGTELSSIGTINLKWSLRGAEGDYLTEFHVLKNRPETGEEPDFDFLLGRDWINESNVLSLNIKTNMKPISTQTLYLHVVQKVRLAQQASEMLSRNSPLHFRSVEET